MRRAAAGRLFGSPDARVDRAVRPRRSQWSPGAHADGMRTSSPGSPVPRGPRGHDRSSIGGRRCPMSRLFRGVIRVFALFFVASTLLGIGSAVVAAFAKRRIVTTQDPASNEPIVASVFAGERFVSSAPALRRGRVITWFAGHDVDLRGATLDLSGATLDLRTMYGGTQIAVPEGWRVRSRVVSI